jgi:hypothetical protein
MYFVFMYKNRTRKSIDFVLRRGKTEGVNPIKYMISTYAICKCHSVSLSYNCYMLIKIMHLYGNKF